MAPAFCSLSYSSMLSVLEGVQAFFDGKGNAEHKPDMLQLDLKVALPWVFVEDFLSDGGQDAMMRHCIAKLWSWGFSLKRPENAYPYLSFFYSNADLWSMSDECGVLRRSLGQLLRQEHHREPTARAQNRDQCRVEVVEIDNKVEMATMQGVIARLREEVQALRAQLGEQSYAKKIIIDNLAKEVEELRAHNSLVRSVSQIPQIRGEEFSDDASTFSLSLSSDSSEHSALSSSEPTCFVANTMLRMISGDWRPVEDVKVGDKVRSASGTALHVTRSTPHWTRELMAIQTDSGANMVVTPDHRVAVVGHPGWKYARDLNEDGDKVLTSGEVSEQFTMTSITSDEDVQVFQVGFNPDEPVESHLAPQRMILSLGFKAPRRRGRMGGGDRVSLPATDDGFN